MFKEKNARKKKGKKNLLEKQNGLKKTKKKLEE